MNCSNVTYFASFEAEYIPRKIQKFKGRKNTTINIYRIQTCDSITCGYLCNGFIDFMFKSKSLSDCNNLRSLNEYEKNDKIILKCFQ